MKSWFRKRGGNRNMNKFLFVLFLLLGIAGLIFQVETGVFVGVALVPWELIKMNVQDKFIIFSLVLCTLIGAIYFIIFSFWYLLGLLVLVVLYNVWGYFNREKFIDNS